MTSLAVTLSIDARGPSGLYIITDSRITWESDAARWDAGQKTFASPRTPDVFGFCGDAFFPPSILRQLLECLNAGLMFADDIDAAGRHTVASEAFQNAMQRRTMAPMRSFSIFHGARDGEFMASRFRLWEIRYDMGTGRWKDQERDIDASRSYLAHVDGSGKRVIELTGREWIDTAAEGTSRAAIWSFCDALHSGKDPYSGGAPQLVGIWRKGPAKSFGFLWHGKKYFAGLEVPNSVIWENVNWFNHLFERCDGRTGSRLKIAQRHRKPNKSSN